MTEDELKARGFPGGDAELHREFKRLFNVEPDYIINTIGSPEWARDLIYGDVQGELNRQASGAKAMRLDVPPLGSWHEPEE